MVLSQSIRTPYHNRNGELVAASYLGTQWMVDKLIYEPKELEYLNYEESAINGYNDLLASFSNDSITSMDTARRVGVEREWEVNRFLASDDVAAPNEVFQYINDEGQVALFSEQEIKAISEWEKGSAYPVHGIEGHHMELVSHNPENIYLAADPDNILLTTSDGHLYHLHSGHYHNATDPYFYTVQLSVEDRFQMALDHNQSEIMLGDLEYGMLAVGGSVATFTTLGLALEWAKLKSAPLSFHEKKQLLMKQGKSYGIVGGILATVGFGSKKMIDHLFENTPFPLVEDVFYDVLALNGAFFTVTATSGLIKYLKERQSGIDKAIADREFANFMKVAAVEFAVFQAIGLGAGVLTEAAADTVIDALIPDPTLILIGARVLYSLSKVGKQLHLASEHKLAYQYCHKLRYTHLYTNGLVEFNNRMKLQTE